MIRGLRNACLLLALIAVASVAVGFALQPTVIASPPFTGPNSENAHWQILGVIVHNVDVPYKTQTTLSARDIQIARARFTDLTHSLGNMSGGRLTADVTILEIHTPLTRLSPANATTGTNGYHASSAVVSDLIAEYVDKTDFHHVMTFLRLDIGNPWAGLYNHTLNGVHFSQIFFGAHNCNWHTQTAFPDQVLVHEFLHGLEYESKRAGHTPICIDTHPWQYQFGNGASGRRAFYTAMLSDPDFGFTRAALAR